MSTKVYTGARCKKSDLVLVLSALQVLAQRHMRERVELIANRLEKNFDVWYKQSDRLAEQWRDPNNEGAFHITAWAQVWIPDGKYVLMALSSNFKHADFPPELREYGYWNNVDRPSTISSREWSARELVWEKALAKQEDEAGQFVVDFIRERDVFLEFYKAMHTEEE